MGSCCSQNPPMCCPFYARCITGGCRRTGQPVPRPGSQASEGCLQCCHEGNCTHAFHGTELGSCCNDGGPPRCCPHYAKCAPGGCQRVMHASPPGPASLGCQECCQRGNCTRAFKGIDMGTCCSKGGPAKCCPYYASCAPGGCR